MPTKLVGDCYDRSMKARKNGDLKEGNADHLDVYKDNRQDTR